MYIWSKDSESQEHVFYSSNIVNINNIDNIDFWTDSTWVISYKICTAIPDFEYHKVKFDVFV